ncbi:UDP-galactopyranose mutase [Nocardioides alpinus]|uniref:NAD(P)/FAD-dependent oxidoreductase n=1 Tax=Nocardioides alpinus TaxID=748909 RepID=A0A1I0X303_9ACTN|nr:NAD(P)/FAD-dependent oxidoreductase [Nocardioides alpinus]PKH44061.1 NAD(P)/FAD-dependent oxidoreductase [Nocardioides alpinus]SFA94736.1 UDP-galactopyranose mutase [Nocardioides alpinus]
MARVVVVGGGFGGMAAAARLAKLGHDVTLLERSATLGGALGTEELDGFAWDAGPTNTLLPAVIRDLFRKSGRPLEREVDLQPLDLVREHRFEDGSALRLPGGSRAAQLAAVDDLGPGLGRQWVDHVASYGDVWELLRKEWFERPFDKDVAPRELTDLIGRRESLEKRLRRTFRDERLRLVAGHRLVMDGHELRDVPVFAGVDVYLEQRFGAWTVPGGLAALGTAMADRLALRGVTVRTATEALDLVVRDGRVTAVRTPDDEVDADRVVVAIDPRRLPALASYVRRTMPAIPPVVCHIGLEGDVPDLPHEVVLHGDPLLVVRTGGRAPDGASAWTVLGRGRLAEDVLTALARHGLDVRRQVVARIDRSPRDLVERWGGSPHGMLWQGPRTARTRLGPRTPIDGVLAAGAHATTGSGLPFAGLSAALVAEVVGRA